MLEKKSSSHAITLTEKISVKLGLIHDIGDAVLMWTMEEYPLIWCFTPNENEQGIGMSNRV